MEIGWLWIVKILYKRITYEKVYVYILDKLLFFDGWSI